MCIVLATTAHPSYALVIIDNRDEFILRPTSRPHWWASQHQEILSARDLQRAEQGTWLGITKNGNFAVLTNYRETDTDDKAHPIQGTRSRGGMVTAWLTGPADESTEEFVHRLLGGEGVNGVGGFSLVCGKLRRLRDSSDELEPLVIISNRSGSPDDVPWIAGKRGEVYGLSNTCYTDPIPWPKVEMGKEKLLGAVQEAIAADLTKEEFVDKLFAVLDTDTLPEQDGQEFQQFIYHLRKSIFIHSVGKAEVPRAAMPDGNMANSGALPKMNGHAMKNENSELNVKDERHLDSDTGNGMSGIYGTQRQTVILVDWEGHVTFIERSLWDAEGHPVERGLGDMKFEFQIEGWNRERSMI